MSQLLQTNQQGFSKLKILKEEAAYLFLDIVTEVLIGCFIAIYKTRL